MTFFSQSNLIPYSAYWSQHKMALWPLLACDFFIMVAYIAIAIAFFFYIKRKRELTFKNFYALFGCFLLLSALYYFISIQAMATPMYGAVVGIKSSLALVALAIAYFTWKYMPEALAYPTIKELLTLNEKHDKILNEVLATTIDAFITIDESGKILSFNKSAERLFLIPASEAVGSNVSILMPPYHAEKHDEYIQSYLHTGKPNVIGVGREVTCQRSDKTTFPAELTVAEICIDGNRYFSGMIRDISEHKAYEKKLNEALAQATLATKAKSRFLANMSHELRTPLNSVIGMAEVMSETTLTKDQEHYVSILMKSGRNLLSIINDILDLSKIEANQLKLENIEFDLQDLTQEVVELLTIKAHEKGIDLNFHLDQSIRGVYLGDPGRIKQVLINLINNAIKFTQKGEVNVWVKDSHNSGAPIEFSVEDTGIGIGQDKIKQIFEDFNQLDSSVTRKFGGTGLGLSISRKLVKLMGGEINVSSQENKGSIFKFTCKIERISSSKLALNKIQLPRTGKLIINEDNATSNKLLQRYLKEIGVEPLFVNDVELTSMIRSKTFRDEDIFIFSIAHQPDRKLKILDNVINFGLSPQRIVCALNIDNYNYSRAKATALGIANFVSRPYRMAELVPTINSLSTSSEDDVSRRKSLLIIDDDCDVLESIKAGAMDLGVEISTASDPIDALTLAESKSFDLILCDYKMPLLSGMEIYERVKRLKSKPHFIFITGFDLAQNPDLDPSVPVLRKPFTHAELAATINQALFGVSGAKPDKSNISTNLAPKSRILIVDDSEENRELMLAHLKSQPYKVDFAENGEVAVRMVKRDPYDLIFMDIQMPVLDGYQATRIIREYEHENNLNHTPIVALTANALDPEKEYQKSTDAGCDAHLTKPILKNTLFTTIKDQLGGIDESSYRQEH